MSYFPCYLSNCYPDCKPICSTPCKRSCYIYPIKVCSPPPCSAPILCSPPMISSFCCSSCNPCGPHIPCVPKCYLCGPSRITCMPTCPPCTVRVYRC